MSRLALLRDSESHTPRVEGRRDGEQGGALGVPLHVLISLHVSSPVFKESWSPSQSQRLRV